MPESINRDTWLTLVGLARNMQIQKFGKYERLADITRRYKAIPISRYCKGTMEKTSVYPYLSDTAAVAEMLGVTVPTVQRWRDLMYTAPVHARNIMNRINAIIDRTSAPKDTAPPTLPAQKDLDLENMTEAGLERLCATLDDMAKKVKEYRELREKQVIDLRQKLANMNDDEIRALGKRLDVAP